MRAALALLLIAVPAQALAAGPPEFFKGQRYTYSEEACRGEAQEAEDPDQAILSTLEVNEAGIFAYEFGCEFLEFWPGGDSPLQTVLASCGDDSGITRPDTFTLVFKTEDPKSITVTSQNEYVMGQTFVSRTYPICASQ